MNVYNELLHIRDPNYFLLTIILAFETSILAQGFPIYRNLVKKIDFEEIGLRIYR